MSFVTLSHWTAVKKMDGAFATAKKQFVPMILATGANSGGNSPNWHLQSLCCCSLFKRQTRK